MSSVTKKTNEGLRVLAFEVRDLFDLYTHKIPLSTDDRIVIIHGPNGVGKTITLKLLHAVFSADFAFLLSIKFASVHVELSDGSYISVVSFSQEEVAEQRRDALKIVYSDGGVEGKFDVHLSQLNFEQWATDLAQRSPYIHAVGNGRYYDMANDIQYTAWELWEQTAAEFTERPSAPLSYEVPPAYGSLISKVSTHLVETQRLVRLSNREPRRGQHGSALTPTVLADARHLAGMLQQVFSNYGRKSQELDQSYPMRLFGNSGTTSIDDIKSMLKAMNEAEARLQDLGILDSVRVLFNVAELDQASDGSLAAMALYATDSREKLVVLNDFADLVAPLLQSLNSKFKNKVVRLDRQRGLVVRSKTGTDIRLNQLSSGEQHELVMLYQLLFRIPRNSLVLIDEPELSLHIDWQRQFLPELLAVCKSAGINALVATHSTSIVGSRRDLLVALDAEGKDA